MLTPTNKIDRKLTQTATPPTRPCPDSPINGTPYLGLTYPAKLPRISTPPTSPNQHAAPLPAAASVCRSTVRRTPPSGRDKAPIDCTSPPPPHGMPNPAADTLYTRRPGVPYSGMPCRRNWPIMQKTHPLALRARGSVFCTPLTADPATLGPRSDSSCKTRPHIDTADPALPGVCPCSCRPTQHAAPINGTPNPG